MIDFFDWAFQHAPHLAFVATIVFASAWLAVKINNFGHRIDATERLCHDINNRQLPALEARMIERFSKLEERMSKVEDRLSKIELTLNRIDTYLSTTASNYPT